MGLKGSKSIVTFLSFQSSVTIVPVYKTSPLGGTSLQSDSLCCAEVIAPKTDWWFTLLLMFEAVPYSSPNILATREIWPRGGHDQRDHACTITSYRLQCLDQLLNLPYLNVLIGLMTIWHFWEASCPRGIIYLNQKTQKSTWIHNYKDKFCKNRKGTEVPKYRIYITQSTKSELYITSKSLLDKWLRIQGYQQPNFVPLWSIL